MLTPVADGSMTPSADEMRGWPWTTWLDHEDRRVALAVGKALVALPPAHAFLTDVDNNVACHVMLRAMFDLADTGARWSELLDVLYCSGFWDRFKSECLLYVDSFVHDEPLWRGLQFDPIDLARIMRRWARTVSGAQLPSVVALLERFESEEIWVSVTRSLPLNRVSRALVERIAERPAGVCGLLMNPATSDGVKLRLANRLLRAYCGGSALPARFDQPAIERCLITAARSAVGPLERVHSRLCRLAADTRDPRMSQMAARMKHYVDTSSPQEVGTRMQEHPALTLSLLFHHGLESEIGSQLPPDAVHDVIGRALRDRSAEMLDDYDLELLQDDPLDGPTQCAIARHPNAHVTQWCALLRAESCAPEAAVTIAETESARLDPEVRRLLRARGGVEVLQWLTLEASPEEVGELFAEMAVKDPEAAAMHLARWRLPENAVWSEDACLKLLQSSVPSIRECGFAWLAVASPRAPNATEAYVPGAAAVAVRAPRSARARR